MGGINWRLVTFEHVRRACEVVAARSSATSPGRGLFVIYQGQRLAAKEVARVAYLLSSSQPLDTRLKFASGESILNLLRRLGCHVERGAPGPDHSRSV